MKKHFKLSYILAILSFLGILSGIYMAFLDAKKPPVSQPISAPAIPPYENFIAGSGIIEAYENTIDLGTLLPGIVDQVFVKVGDRLKKGAPIFSLDAREAQASVKVKEASLQKAKKALLATQAILKDEKDRLQFLNHVSDKRALSKEEIQTQTNRVLIAQSHVKTSQAAVQEAQEDLQAALVHLSCHIITAPLDCEILQSNINPGSYADKGIPSPPLMRIGKTSKYQIRVDIDETDAWRFQKNQEAVAFLRGNIQYTTPLTYEYVEPYVVPKKSLTGDATERVDTRVLEIIYSFDPEKMPSYIGQQVDVYIKTPKVSENALFMPSRGSSQ